MNNMKLARHSLIASALAIALLSFSAASLAEGGHSGHANFAPRGQVFGSLPREAVAVRYHGGAYYYRGGEWYRPWGSRFVVIAPPFGAVVPFLPGFYTTFWFGGIPYYYANDAYYMWSASDGGYVVTRPPADVTPSTVAPVSAASNEPYIRRMVRASSCRRTTATNAIAGRPRRPALTRPSRALVLPGRKVRTAQPTIGPSRPALRAAGTASSKYTDHGRSPAVATFDAWQLGFCRSWRVPGAALTDRVTSAPDPDSGEHTPCLCGRGRLRAMQLLRCKARLQPIAHTPEPC